MHPYTALNRFGGTFTMHQLLHQIISEKQIETVFQPVFNVSERRIIGFEALSRGPQGSPLYCPQRLFDTAIQCGYLYELEILCRRLAVKAFAKLKLPGFLFLNINPMVLTNLNYPEGSTLKMLEKAGIDNDRVIIEISEKYPVDAPGLLRTTLEKYRKYGFKVAIDNFGAGYHGLQQWSELRPDWIKVDRSFIENCFSDMVKKEFLRTLIELGKSTNVGIIMQGIESNDEFEQLIELGMQNAQGYMLARPEQNPEQGFPSSLKVALHKEIPVGINGPVSQLVTSTVTCESKAKAGQIYKLLSSKPKLQCLPVLKGNKVVGMVMRHRFMEKFSDIYSHALFDGHSIEGFMDTNPLILDSETSLDQASLYITERDDEDFGRYFIVTRNGQYVGLASSRELLRRITASKLEKARYANPLTLLPGNVPIDREIDYLLDKKLPFQLAYVDIDHFKPFNDVFGYAKGDQLIILLAQILQECCKNAQTFVGHIGGDDFIVLFKSMSSKRICENILDAFAEKSLQFFESTDIQNNGYTAVNRNGEQTHYSLPSISIGVVTPDVDTCQGHNDVSTMATEAKKQAKKLPGNQVFYCRRSQPYHLSNDEPDADNQQDENLALA